MEETSRVFGAEDVFYFRPQAQQSVPKNEVNINELYDHAQISTLKNLPYMNIKQQAAKRPHY